MSTFTCLLFVSLLVITSTQAHANSTKIYVWRNADGVLVYSDSPKPGAEEVKVNKANNFTSSIDTSILDVAPNVVQEQFKVHISQPTNHATIRDNTGSVYVQGNVTPTFKQNLKIQLLLDNTPHQLPQTNAMFLLKNIERGEHQLQMQLINEKGKVIALSTPVTFYMHKSSVTRSN